MDREGDTPKLPFGLGTSLAAALAAAAFAAAAFDAAGIAAAGVASLRHDRRGEGAPPGGRCSSSRARRGRGRGLHAEQGSSSR